MTLTSSQPWIRSRSRSANRGFSGTSWYHWYIEETYIDSNNRKTIKNQIVQPYFCKYCTKTHCKTAYFASAGDVPLIPIGIIADIPVLLVNSLIIASQSNCFILTATSAIHPHDSCFCFAIDKYNNTVLRVTLRSSSPSNQIVNYRSYLHDQYLNSY